MNRIADIYDSLGLFLDNINISDSNSGDYLFNGKTEAQFLNELEKILSSIRTEIINTPFESLEECSKEISDKIESFSLYLIAKESFSNLDLIPNELVNVFVTRILDRLHKHCHTIFIDPCLPIQWNEKSNKLVDIFYQLLEDLKNPAKEPLLKTSKSNMARFIAKNFLDRNGKPFKFNTVYKVLGTENKDKRPPQGHRIELRYLAM